MAGNAELKGLIEVMTYLAMLASLEEGCDSYKTVLIVPHHFIRGIICFMWDFESVPENFVALSVSVHDELKRRTYR